jgi:spermidine synthase
MIHQDSHARKSVFLRRLFRHSDLYMGPTPTYPVGTWCYNFLSDTIDPAAVRRLRIPKGLKFYNPEIHRAAFALPNFLAERLAKGK